MLGSTSKTTSLTTGPTVTDQAHQNVLRMPRMTLNTQKRGKCIQG